MKNFHDPELEDILQDDELRRIATLLSSAAMPEPPLDDAFRTGLRRQLMQQAWGEAEGGSSWWRRAFAPPGLAWAGAAAGLVLIASVVVFVATQKPGGLTEVVVNSPLDGGKQVALQQPILVSFNQPMDHRSTEAAVQISPATNVAFSWQNSNTLAVLPTSGNLAPNTQYQVTIGPGAKTAAGQELAAPQTITFVTQPPPAPTPTPTAKPSPTPGNALTGEKQLTTLGGAATAPIQWSADSSTIYLVDAKGALKVIPAKGGELTSVAPDGVSSPAVAPAGDRLAYIRLGKIEVLTFAAGTTAEVVPTPSPTFVGWSKDKLVWAAADGLYMEGANAPTRLRKLPSGGTVTVLSISPDGAQVAYAQDQTLVLLDLTSGKTTPLGQAGAQFLGWSPGGGHVLYSSPDGTTVVDLQTTSTSTLPAGEPSWSSQDAILLGGDTTLYELRPDGTAQTKLANGTYHNPLWAPNGSTFTYFRGGALWVASAPPLPAQPTALDQAAVTVNSFMQARLKVQPELASVYLDDSGKKAYAGGGLSLVINGDTPLSRFYILTQELASTQPDTTRFVVRLVLSRGKIDVSDFEETLTLVRDATTRQFLIDQATAAGAHRLLGKGAEVVGVEVTADTIKVTFDSDLDPGTVQDGVSIVDSKGKRVDATMTYAQRVVTITGLDLKAAGHYKLVVQTSVRDVQGHNVPTDYELELLGPAVKKTGDRKQASSGAPASPTPVASPQG
jgi:hypothetical protein